MSHGIAFPEAGRGTFAHAVLLAIDDASLPVRKGLCYYLTRPAVRAEPVLEASARDSRAPDNCAAHFYGTVLHDQGRFRMWYYACHWGRNPDWPPRMQQQIARRAGWLKNDAEMFAGPLCYAESEDGLVWRKPQLGQVPFKGDRKNNALALPHTVVSGATVIKEDDDPDPNRRYKMVYEYFPDLSAPPIEEYGNLPTIATAVSPDGLIWTVTSIPYRNEFVEHASFYRYRGLYIVNYQSASEWTACSEGGASRGRTGFVKISPDFERWMDGQVESFALPEPVRPEDRGVNGAYDQVHLGVGAASLGNVCVGLFGRWHNAHYSEAFDKISCDLGLVVSHDGLHFREPVKDFIFISRYDSPVRPVPGKTYNTNLCQANGILNVGDETRIYHGRWRNSGAGPADLPHYGAEVALAVIPRDRWGALGLNPQETEGQVWSAPVRLPDHGCELAVNADGREGIRIEITDERFVKLPAFSGAHHGAPVPGAGLDTRVQWPNGGLAALGGRTIRFGIHLRQTGPALPRLYAVYLAAAAGGR